MQRYFIQKKQITQSTIQMTKEDSHHIKNVMRMKIGEKVTCCDDSQTYLCEIKTFEPVVLLSIIETYDENNETTVRVLIAHGLVRREKTEEVIRRLTELGCSEYVPIILHRSMVKPMDEKSSRWQIIIKEASEQAHRTHKMVLHSTQTLKQLVEQTKDFDLRLFADPSMGLSSLKQVMSMKQFKAIAVIIGPEGGLEPSECQFLIESGFVGVHLGKRILRTETAPLYVMSAIAYHYGDQDEN